MRRFLFALPLIALTSCTFHSTDRDFEAAFFPALQLCMDQYFPDQSMKLSKEQMAARQRVIAERRDDAERIFETSKGEEYLQAELTDQVDDQKAFCVSDMLKRIRKQES